MKNKTLRGKGFSLVEILVVIAIIGILSTISAVSFNGIVASARDAARLNDMYVIKTAMEVLNYSDNGYMDSGCQSGIVSACPASPQLQRLINLPNFNDPQEKISACPETCSDSQSCNYTLLSLSNDSYTVRFNLEKGTGSLTAGCYTLHNGAIYQIGASTGNEIAPSTVVESTVWPDSNNPPEQTDQVVSSPIVQGVSDMITGAIGAVSVVPTDQIKKAVDEKIAGYVRDVQKLKKSTIDQPVIEKINLETRNPVIATIAAATTASLVTIGLTGASGSGILTYLQFIFTQPFLLIFSGGRKKRWGIVYNAITKLPVDLAIVRVYDAISNRLIQTKVTDRFGRYQFILSPGRYYISVSKKEFRFPSQLLAGTKNDGRFQDINYGEHFEVSKDGAVTYPVAIDPEKIYRNAKTVLQLRFWRKVQFVICLLGPIFSIVSFVINPGLLIGSVVLVQLFLYLIFKRLAYAERPDSYGIVRDKETKRGLGKAIVRVFDTKFNKLLDTQVTDWVGRYAFLVGSNRYYYTAEKPGYYPHRSRILNFEKKLAAYVAEKVSLIPHHLGADIVKAQALGQDMTIRTPLGRQEEVEDNNIKKAARRHAEKFEGKLPDVKLEEMHEDYYNIDTIKSKKKKDLL